ncbi:MAG TPA: methylated-DNA--[protein]-cysteine S-methyltransferase [Actinomycetota bacterium]|nr:methylated-DNA--[protein]-cysteine S-methyltransferase [Actinomycetota bacterium]
MKTNDLRSLVSATQARTRARAADEEVRARAQNEGEVDVALGTVASPIGELLVAVTPRGLACVAFEGEDRNALLERFAKELSPRVLRASRATDLACRQLEEYFEGSRRRFQLRLDRRLMTPFARQVLAATSRVGFGRLATYGQIAARIDRPTAARAVGAALGSNPIPIVVPCHRVVGASGKLTGYAGGLDRKAFLLRLEGDPTLFRL